MSYRQNKTRRVEPQHVSRTQAMKVFISHSAVDAHTASAIAKRLTGVGVSPFLDMHHVEVGDDIVARVIEGLAQCSVLLLVVSPASLRSGWVQFEVGQAMARGMRILPFLMHPSLELPGYLSRFRNTTKVAEIETFLLTPPKDQVAVTDGFASSSSEKQYSEAVKATIESFAIAAAKRDVHAPISLERHVGASVMEFLRYAATALWVIVRGILESKSLAWADEERDAFIYYGFVAMSRGFLLDRFVDTHDFARDNLPPLPEFTTLSKRWYESVVTADAWLHEWTEPYTRDLVDGEWSKFGSPPFVEALSHDDPKRSILGYGVKVAILQGMVARRFLRLGAPVINEETSEVEDLPLK